jgi:hypothetical protein
MVKLDLSSVLDSTTAAEVLMQLGPVVACDR